MNDKKINKYCYYIKSKRKKKKKEKHLKLMIALWFLMMI